MSQCERDCLCFKCWPEHDYIQEERDRKTALCVEGVSPPAPRSGKGNGALEKAMEVIYAYEHQQYLKQVPETIDVIRKTLLKRNECQTPMDSTSK